MRLRIFGFIALVALACSTVTCALVAREVSVISTGSDGLRTYSVVRERDGVLVTCGLNAVEPHVTGILDGNPTDGERLWLTNEAGRRLSVVWPGGFTVTFEPTAMLHDAAGRTVARAGDKVELSQVSTTSAAGTPDDPYIASCFVLGGTYVYLPD